MQVEYSDSADFTEELFAMQAALAKATAIATSARWVRWMQATDRNFCTQTVEANRQLVALLGNAVVASDKLGDMLHEAA